MKSPDEYQTKFEGEFWNEKDKRFRAFQTALDTRKFEIELYWKRATYFWAFIALAFTGYFGTITQSSDRRLIPFIISCIGAFFTFSFFCVNRGSKFWQENWENHVSMLAESIVGPLFSTVLIRSEDKPWVKKIIFTPQAISVSRINQSLSLYLLAIWCGLICFASPLEFPTYCFAKHPFLLTFCFTLVYAVLTYFTSRTNFGLQRAAKRTIVTELVDR